MACREGDTGKAVWTGGVAMFLYIFRVNDGGMCVVVRAESYMLALDALYFSEGQHVDCAELVNYTEPDGMTVEEA